MLATPRTITSRYSTSTGRFLSRERLLWMYRVELERLEELARNGDDVADLLTVMRGRVRTLEASQDLDWACERSA